jgi:hypothetical protein
LQRRQVLRLSSAIHERPLSSPRRGDTGIVATARHVGLGYSITSVAAIN